MTWNPEEGFHLEAFLERTQIMPRVIRIGRIGVIPRSDYSSFRMRIQGYDWAIAPHVHLADFDWFDIQRGHLSKNFKQVIFCKSRSPYYSNSVWAGSALYVTKSSDLKFTDRVHHFTHISNQQFAENWRSSGIWYNSDGQEYSLRGYLTDQNRLQLHWQIPRSQWSKSQGWRWASAIQDALSIWQGETICLVQREMYRGVQKITEVRQQEPLYSLSFLSPLDDRKLDRDSLIKLIEFFALNSNNANVCQNIFWQLIEASYQKGWQARELLVSTILEAALRTIYNYPLHQNDNSNGLVQSLLAKFRNDFFSIGSDELKKQWKKECNRVLESFKRLRHRNAHPDWLEDSGGSFSGDRLDKSFNDLILLSRFYGYMMLGLAGFEGLVPHLPQPFSNQTIGALTQVEEDESFPSHPFTDRKNIDPTLQLAESLRLAKTYHQRTMIDRKFYLEKASNLPTTLDNFDH
ncbi:MULTISPECIES: hypothetical protein [Leptolyngbya]|uniref:hypothetical protein n=1 Tax=Leptolyngbya TaxID=47251 RepID=UPI001681E467|nr:hypothetical protein [Leptolyngbya sp. FACHB-1624]MBD1857251.1 hypothetical protein [Leptolyngbya sp. FACHB-1624]